MSDRVRTVDMSDPAVVLDCYRKLNVAYKELKAENEKLRAELRDADEMLLKQARTIRDYQDEAAALKETGDE